MNYVKSVKNKNIKKTDFMIRRCMPLRQQLNFCIEEVRVKKKINQHLLYERTLWGTVKGKALWLCPSKMLILFNQSSRRATTYNERQGFSCRASDGQNQPLAIWVTLPNYTYLLQGLYSQQGLKLALNLQRVEFRYRGVAWGSCGQNK